MPESLHGKTALITGAGKRIGRATALALAQAGTNIIAHFRSSAAEAQSLCDELQATGVRAWPIYADLEKPTEYESLLERALKLSGTVDILYNNASIFPANTLKNVTFSEVVKNLEVNAWAPFVLSRAFAQQVGRGKIINALDSRLEGYEWTHVAYIFSKQVLALMTRMLALEYAPDITVNAVAPGLILPPPGKDDSYLEQTRKTVPLKRHGGPQDIADAVVFLAQSSFITGQVIFVDGGRHLWEYVNGPHPD